MKKTPERNKLAVRRKRNGKNKKEKRVRQFYPRFKKLRYIQIVGKFVCVCVCWFSLFNLEYKHSVATCPIFVKVHRKASLSHLLKVAETRYYSLQTKLRESNAFVGMCLFTGGTRVGKVPLHPHPHPPTPDMAPATYA